MPSHFYVPLEGRVPAPGERIELPAEQLHYITRVLRFKSGATMACFDGAGLSFKVEVELSRNAAVLNVVATDQRAQQPEHANHLALALLKGAAMDRAIQLACESGADELSIFLADRSNVKLDERRLNNKTNHWQKVIIGACEQSGRLFLPAFNPTARLASLLDTHTNAYVLHMDGGPFNFHLGADRLLLIGPEGGWSEQELDSFERARVQRVSVGPNTLRAESTPGAALAILSYLDSTQ